MAYVADVKAAQETLARLMRLRAQEEASVMDRIKRLRKFERDWTNLEFREREEWRAFNLRVDPLEREIKVIVSLLANVKAMETLPPVVIVL